MKFTLSILPGLGLAALLVAGAAVAADTSTLTTAQVNTLATTDTDRVVVQPVTRKVNARTTTMRFYFPDASAAVQGLRLEIRSNEFFEDVRLADISGAGAANAITTAEMTALMQTLQKLHVGRVMP